jgi:hypothetical protein
VGPEDPDALSSSFHHQFKVKRAAAAAGE